MTSVRAIKAQHLKKAGATSQTTKRKPSLFFKKKFKK
jgi:hypothetical protein